MSNASTYRVKQRRRNKLGDRKVEKRSYPNLIGVLVRPPLPFGILMLMTNRLGLCIDGIRGAEWCF